MNAHTAVELHEDAELIDQLGGPAAVARALGFQMPRGTQRVQNWKYRGIPPFTRVTRTEVFGPAVFRVTPAAAAEITKRELREKLGLLNDAGLAVLLKLPRDQVEAWGEDEQLPALPTVLALVATQPTEEPKAPSDLDAERIVPVEVA